MSTTIANRPMEPSAMISIGMPVFNGERFVERAIESILGQTYTHFELIISDNGSTDRTEEICRRFAEKDPRIRYIRQSCNIGPAANFRFVLEAANYDRFIWAAADDWWDRDRLEKLVNALRPEDAVVVGTIKRYLGDSCFAAYTPMAYRRGQWWRFLMREEGRSEKVYYIYGLMWRDSALRSFADVRDEYAADGIFCYRMLWSGNLKSIDNATLHVSTHIQSTSAQKAASYRYSLIRFLFCAHPLSYYANYIRATPKNVRLWVALAIPLKAVVSQIHLWWRAFRRIVLKRPFVHGALPGGEKIVRDAGI